MSSPEGELISSFRRRVSSSCRGIKKAEGDYLPELNSKDFSAEARMSSREVRVIKCVRTSIYLKTSQVPRRGRFILAETKTEEDYRLPEED